MAVSTIELDNFRILKALAASVIEWPMVNAVTKTSRYLREFEFAERHNERINKT